MGLLERLNEFITAKGFSMKAFEESVGMSNGSLGTTIKNGQGIRSDKLENILSVHPDLSAEWLLRGTGSMFLDDREQMGGVNNKYFVICQLLLQNRQKDNELYSELAKLMSKE